LGVLGFTGGSRALYRRRRAAAFISTARRIGRPQHCQAATWRRGGRRSFFAENPLGVSLGCLAWRWAAAGFVGLRQEKRKRGKELGYCPKIERERVFSLFENLFLFCNQNPLLF
jgi:hypothetical protein